MKLLTRDRLEKPFQGVGRLLSDPVEILLAEFDRERFLTGFLKVLPSAIGDSRVHAGSFVMAWNRLYPGEEWTSAEILRRAGIP